MAHLKPWQIFLIVFFCVLIAGAISFVVWWFVFKDKKSKSKEVQFTSRVLQDHMGVGRVAFRGPASQMSTRSAAGTTPLAACPPVSEELQAQLHLPPDCLVCDHMPYDWHERTRDYHFHGVHQTAEKGPPKFIFVPRSADDLVISLENVSGEFSSGYFLHNPEEPDMWWDGFDPDTKEDVETHVQRMRDQIGEAVCFVGDEAAPSSGCETRFQFNAMDPFPIPMRSLSKAEKTKLAIISGPALQGCMRFSVDHCDYHFTLAGQPVRVRVLVANKEGEMGDKMLFIDGAFKWLDLETHQFVTTRNTNCLSFWNQPHHEGEGGPPPEEEGPPPEGEYYSDEQHEVMHAEMVRLFAERRFGMPVELADEEVDFTRLGTHNAVIDLLVDTFVSFRGAVVQGLTEQDLLNQPQKILELFDIPDVNFKAKITFTE